MMNQTVLKLLETLNRNGIEIKYTEEGKLLLCPKPPENLLKKIRDNKAEIISLLRVRLLQPSLSGVSEVQKPAKDLIRNDRVQKKAAVVVNILSPSEMLTTGSETLKFEWPDIDIDLLKCELLNMIDLTKFELPNVDLSKIEWPEIDLLELERDLKKEFCGYFKKGIKNVKPFEKILMGKRTKYQY